VMMLARTFVWNALHPAGAHSFTCEAGTYTTSVTATYQVTETDVLHCLGSVQAVGLTLTPILSTSTNPYTADQGHHPHYENCRTNASIKSAPTSLTTDAHTKNGMFFCMDITPIVGHESQSANTGSFYQMRPMFLQAYYYISSPVANASLPSAPGRIGFDEVLKIYTGVGYSAPAPFTGVSPAVSPVYTHNLLYTIYWTAQGGTSFPQYSGYHAVAQ
jgi:hypothetical protein